MVTAVRVVVRTVDVSVVVIVARVEGVAVAAAATVATVAGCSGASDANGFALAYPNEPTKTPSVVSRPPSFRPHAGTGPDRLRPGPVLAGIGGRGEVFVVIAHMNTDRRERCFEKQLRVRRAAVLS